MVGVMKNISGFSVANFAIMIAVVVIGFYLFMYIPYVNEQTFEKFKNNQDFSVNEKILVDKYKKKDNPEISPFGLYMRDGIIKNKKSSLKYYFGEDGTLTKELTVLETYTARGIAKYYFDGSVMMFSDVVGDKGLFPVIGDPVTVMEDGILIYENGLPENEIKLMKLSDDDDV